MPLRSAHVFASHIGHTGKTTLCFQLSCQYALQHPELRVLVIDLAEEGDLTKRMLGGVDSAADKVEELFGSVFRILADAQTRRAGLTSWLRSAGAGSLDIMDYAVRVADHNAHVPGNLHLISSGAWPRDEEPMDEATRKETCRKILAALEASRETWKLFCDTDGDRRPSAFTQLGYGLCPHAIVPLHLSKADLDRTETMLGLLHEMREEGAIETQVQLVVWNNLKSLKDEPFQHGESLLPFTPSKVSLDILEACNARLLRTARELPGVFVHGEAPDAEFLRSSTCVLRSLADTVLRPSEELGQPFAHMVRSLEESGKAHLKFRSGGVEYMAGTAQIHGVRDAMRALEERFEAISLTSGTAA